ncbi:magnesium transporter CorA family protein [Candidatus Peregrinibacteria bacterium]|nr:magnesium transporter CorA family protein [Candidatus Peregrinibacteria bacterium]
MRSLTVSGVAWHDCTQPTRSELHAVQRRYRFHTLDIDDCLSDHERPKIEEYASYLFLVFHIPYGRAATGRILKEEINIFFGQDFLVTVRDGKSPSVDRLWRGLHTSKRRREEYFGRGAGFLLYRLMRDLFAESFPLVEGIMRELRRIEESLFGGEDQHGMLQAILMLRRNIITMRSILHPQRAIVAHLEHKRQFIAEDLALYFDDVLDAIERQWALLDTAKEMSEALQATHESWLTQKTNTIIRILTGFTVITLPFIIVPGIYGMNVTLPFQVHPLVFVSLMLGMAVATVVLLLYFIGKKWL